MSSAFTGRKRPQHRKGRLGSAEERAGEAPVVGKQAGNVKRLWLTLILTLTVGIGPRSPIW